MPRNMINYLIGGLCLVCIGCLPGFTYADGKIDMAPYDKANDIHVTCVSS